MRYAVYYSAARTEPLAELGNTWLGRDPFTNTPLTQPKIDGISAAELWQYTETPRRYGFHGTFKPPFELAEGVTEDMVCEQVRSFAARTRPFQLDGIAPNRLGAFLALTPTAPSEGLNDLASRAIRELDTLRAPLSDADIARRRQSGLTPEQDAYMLQWGYPYIFEFFRFHLTLTGKINDKTVMPALQAAAEHHFAPVLNKPVTINQIALYVEEERGGPFRVAETFRFEGASQ
ncbi:DUF1045 domain-containing protein [Pseudovibrio exalbescens]|uniref:DUF1045 domain-containing protein n=1 Tax=Pseudovibrio exalbescens TaxID=197461 RepID=UPI0023663197|nr:DUF1045 domain-containing protein [Pseudovibrio exalbescens]MDD7911777.1 DUF1045 domain-containing protein [Pseudovibrio exalbescens]